MYKAMQLSFEVRCGSCLNSGRVPELSGRGRALAQSCQPGSYHFQYTSLLLVCSFIPLAPALTYKIVRVCGKKKKFNMVLLCRII